MLFRSVTLAGGNFVGRMGTSFLRTLGEPGWVAEDEAGYVAKAAALARDVVALRGARAQLRDRMARSPLCDIAEYVKQLEDLYRRMWHFSGVSPPQRLLAAVPEKVGA